MSEDTITIDTSEYDISALDSTPIGPITTVSGLGGIGNINMNTSNAIYTSGSGSNGISYGNITIANGASGSWGASPYMYTTSGTTTPGLHVTSDAEFDGDIKWKGRSLGKMLEDIEKRLAILVPDPAKLEKFEALKKAYEHYKLMEKLCDVSDSDNTES